MLYKPCDVLYCINVICSPSIKFFYFSPSLWENWYMGVPCWDHTTTAQSLCWEDSSSTLPKAEEKPAAAVFTASVQFFASRDHTNGLWRAESWHRHWQLSETATFFRCLNRHIGYVNLFLFGSFCCMLTISRLNIHKVLVLASYFIVLELFTPLLLGLFFGKLWFDVILGRNMAAQMMSDMPATGGPAQLLISNTDFGLSDLGGFVWVWANNCNEAVVLINW
jgi:hypothetical protein